MFNGFYGAPEKVVVPYPAGSTLYQSFFEVEASLIKQSYTKFSLARIHTNQRAIKQTEATVCKVRSAIEKQLLLSREKVKLLAERESLNLQVTLMQEEVARQSRLLQRERELQHRSGIRIDSKARDVITKRERLRKDKVQIQEHRNEHINKREILLKYKSQLSARRRQLVSELSFIYPIVELSNHTHLICGVKLPNAEGYSGTDETTISTALGYTCHLMIKMSQFLQLPLRYPMYHRGSRSIIRDHVNDKLQDRDRDFPLYSKGKERFQFNYAVYLLNKNVAQLRYFCGLPTTDLRATLPNLKSLLELRWGVKFDYQNQMTVYPEKKPITPSKVSNNSQLTQTDDLQPLMTNHSKIGSPKVSPKASPRASPKVSPRASPHGSPLKGRRISVESTDSASPETFVQLHMTASELQGSVMSPPRTRSDRVRELEGVVSMSYQGEIESDEVGKEAITMEEEIDSNTINFGSRKSSAEILSDSSEELDEQETSELYEGAACYTQKDNATVENSTDNIERPSKESPRRIFSQEVDSDDSEEAAASENDCTVSVCNSDDANTILHNVNALDGLDEISSRTDALSNTGRSTSFRFQSPVHQKTGNNI
ncbi:UV radiation resistance-associated gene protein-like [Saccoglossus kowalevskii]